MKTKWLVLRDCLGEKYEFNTETSHYEEYQDMIWVSEKSLDEREAPQISFYKNNLIYKAIVYKEDEE